ncbi:unnamed protein product [Blepharisma stoltei]|uniref:Uncharacterized protein n=1 Tax=Blepharisma stoltei TaxID=1481888 RepID=A0AAU9IPR4_9CILI|nr:unnamed protein product [Blepharisma stoltei]
MDSYTERGLEEKIASIRATLKRLGSSLEEDEFEEGGTGAVASSHSKYSQDSDSSDSNSFNIPATFDALKNRQQESYTPEDPWESKSTLDYEKEKNALLEKQIKEKDQTIKDLMALQSGLKDSIEKNLEDLKKAQDEAYGYKQQLDNLNNENNGLRRILAEKDREIAKYRNDFENFKKEKEASMKEFERTRRQAEKVEELFEEVNRLKDLNHALKSRSGEIAQDPSNSRIISSYQEQLNIRDCQINELEKERLVLLKEIDRIKSEKRRTPPIKLSRDENYLEDTQSKEKVSAQPLTERAQAASSYKELCKDMMKILSVSHRKDLFSKVLHLQQFHEKFKKEKKLINNIANLIIDCSPPNSFEKSPNVHQIWKWFTKILEEYMKLKQSPYQDIINELCNIVKTDPINLIDDVKNVISDNYKLKSQRQRQDFPTRERKLS